MRLSVPDAVGTYRNPKQIITETKRKITQPRLLT